MPITLPQHFKIVEGAAPATDAAGRTAKYISLKNVIRAWIVVYMDQGNAATVALTPYQATAVAGTSEKVLANAVPIWSNEDAATTDTLARQTDAVNYTTSAALKHKQVVFQIDPAQLDTNNGFDCITIKTGASNAGNLTSVQYFLETRFPGATPPTVITD
jgi:hypothetical protein